MDFRRRFILGTSAAISGLIAVVQLTSERAEITVLEAQYVVCGNASAGSTTFQACSMSHMLAGDAVKLGSFATLESRELRSCYSS